MEPPAQPSPPPPPNTPLAGNLLLAFNGETLSADDALDIDQLTPTPLAMRLALTRSAAQLVKTALETLSTIIKVGVAVSAELNEAATRVNLTVEIEFHFGDRADHRHKTLAPCP